LPDKFIFVLLSILFLLNALWSRIGLDTLWSRRRFCNFLGGHISNGLIPFINYFSFIFLLFICEFYVFLEDKLLYSRSLFLFCLIIVSIILTIVVVFNTLFLGFRISDDFGLVNAVVKCLNGFWNAIERWRITTTFILYARNLTYVLGRADIRFFILNSNIVIYSQVCFVIWHWGGSISWLKITMRVSCWDS